MANSLREYRHAINGCRRQEALQFVVSLDDAAALAEEDALCRALPSSRNRAKISRITS
jgi:hypothetical protein